MLINNMNSLAVSRTIDRDPTRSRLESSKTFLHDKPSLNAERKSGLISPSYTNISGDGVTRKDIMDSDIYGRCGVITACLTDPLSQLINKIMGLKDDDANSVGFYYEAELHGINKCTVILFNIYDNDAVPWLRLGYTMNLLLASPFVTKITYYPIVTSSESSIRSSSFSNQSSLLSRSSMKSKPVNKRLEETFRAVVVQTIGMNAKAIHDKNISYTGLLLRIAGITGEEVDRLVNTIITGYSLVNKVLLTLMGIESADLSKISTSIVPCPLLRQPISITAPRETNNESDVKYIIEESRREITKLVAIFVDLFTTHEEFRSNILATRSNKSNHLSLEGLFLRESELISHLVGGLQNGIISSATLNDIIKDLNVERFNLGNYQQLPITTTPKSTLHVTDDNLMCTFQVPNVVHDTDPLRDLGEYIGYIADSFDSSEVLTINLGGMIAAYNNAIKGSNLKKITIPKVGFGDSPSSKPRTGSLKEFGSNRQNRSLGGLSKHTLSRSAVVTIPGSPDGDNITISTNSNHIVIPMYNSNLTTLTESQLMDILVYLDSLRTSDGTGDTRFANLQNEVTYELACRRHPE